jgi:hypothetical protein
MKQTLYFSPYLYNAARKGPSKYLILVKWIYGICNFIKMSFRKNGDFFLNGNDYF